MPNSSCVRTWKNQILSDLQNDNEIISALGLHNDETPEDLVYNRLFPHYFIAPVQEEVKTYIMVEIDIRSNQNRFRPNVPDVYSYPTITFTILLHQDHMKMNLAGVSATRADYLAELIDRKYNGLSGFGIGEIHLVSNIAGSLNDTYRYRQLVFQALDLNDSLCD